jgi:hypothetical protein
MLCTNNTHVGKICGIFTIGLRHYWMKNLESLATDHLDSGPFDFPFSSRKG